MKKFIFSAAFILLLAACDNNSPEKPQSGNIDYRQEMRDFVCNISQYARGVNSNFIIIPQNGQEIITQNGESDGQPVSEYLTAIDGTGREDLFYGYSSDNTATPENEIDYMIAYCDLCEQNGIEVLVIDYCSSHDKMDDSYQQNQIKGYISFAAPDRELNFIPDYPPHPFNANNNDITSLKNAKNFLYLINPEKFTSKQNFISTVSATDYDLIIMDCFFNEQSFTAAEITQLKTKHNGGKRLIISYLSIGEAEDYRYYWQDGWKTNPPDWLAAENANWEGNYKVKYWNDDWQQIIYGTVESYLGKIIAAGFDGVYLDIIDAFEYFEEIDNNR